ncbi:MAG TPA: discoidin domain-containing protein [Acidimicrobiia bacterium]|nr:discoidin domain-containing protein [Acidimicrobiia bacterium]
MPRIVWLAFLVAVAACSSGDVEAGVRPFSEIAETDPVIEFDPGGTAATLRVTTTIDAVCAVAYGPDGPYGSIATDREMGIGGHSDHEAMMTGLEPNTTYLYRLQGVGADGMVYRSEVFTFTTPAGDQGTDLGPNLAVGATIVEVSSEFSDAFVAENAIDGDLGTEWSTRGDGNNAFITIDLGAVVEVAAVGFRTRSMSDGTATTESFTVIVDGDTNGPFPAGPSPTGVSFHGQILTFEVTESTGGNTGAVEIEVYSK